MLNRTSFYLFFFKFPLITLTCTTYNPHFISFVYEYLGRAPVLWWPGHSEQLSSAWALPSAGKAGEVEEIQHHCHVRTGQGWDSQVNRNWVPESFFISTGKKKSNKCGTLNANCKLMWLPFNLNEKNSECRYSMNKYYCLHLQMFSEIKSKTQASMHWNFSC